MKTQTKSAVLLNRVKKVPHLLLRLSQGDFSLKSPFSKALGLDDRLHEYLLDVSLREADILRQLREETATLPVSGMQISPEQGQFMALLVQLIHARKVLEVGVFTGYSSLAVALALPPDAQLIACDVNEDFTRMAKRYWQKGGVDHKIDLKLAPAVETLDQLIVSGQTGSFDFAFIDADKENHPIYYEQALQLVRSGGLIIIDNALWFGKVADPRYQDNATQAIRQLNEKLHTDERVMHSLLPVADGLALVMKR